MKGIFAASHPMGGVGIDLKWYELLHDILNEKRSVHGLRSLFPSFPTKKAALEYSGK